MTSSLASPQRWAWLLVAACTGLTTACGVSYTVSPPQGSTTPDATSPGAQVTSAIDAATAAEGETALGAMTRAQQAYHMEKGAFAANLNELALGLPTDGPNYALAIAEANAQQVVMTATAKEGKAPSLTSAVFVTPEKSTVLIVCKGEAPSATPPAPPTYEGEPTCAAGSVPIK